ncbi:sugar kinase, ribokinase family [Candidatus Moduliflexus flocculans]|uniref:Sugar kinase, ribokinase family n=1 Tax=Candidatus Moduliflexus flocculans TaxID=1499966 RepID=A0A0S6VU78_9BACT|nr:sugar kinase, ribokinase family [Candidatus Moduliflexus flocculans]
MQKFVTVVGGINVDLTGSPHQPLVLATSNPGETSLSVGGVGRNIAHNLALLGVPTTLLSAVGDDAFGVYALDITRQAGVNIEYVLKQAGQRTGTYLSVLNFEHDLVVAIADMAATRGVSASYLAQHERILTESALIAADANLEEETLTYLCNLCETRRIPLLIEPVSVEKSKKLHRMNAKATYLTPNRDELHAMTGRDDADLAAQCACLRDQFDHIFVTLGEQGVYYCQSYPAIPTTVVNANGAGDALVAGLICGLFHEKPLSDSIRLGIAAAHIALQSPETVNPELSFSRIQGM